MSQVDYDAVIVGAGPAGGQCARELSRLGRRVLLIDKAHDLLDNNYSSGGAPQEILEEFNLPRSIVGTFWNKLTIHSTNEKSSWESPQPFGPVIEFDKLRSFLSEETVKWGSEFRLSCQYQSHITHNNEIEVQLKDLNSQVVRTVSTRTLVDASGSERKVLAKDHYNKDEAIVFTGIEYHVEVDPQIYEQQARTLNFFLGLKWMPQGYAWIFPMAPNKLKVGVIRYFQNKVFVPHDPSYKPYLNQLLDFCGQPDTYKVEDKHGKTIYYTKGQKEARYAGPILAIGDSISSINPLGCEGIRHAMVSGHKGALVIDSYLKGQTTSFKDYDIEMNGYFGKKWFFSEMLMKNLFKTTNDSFIDKTVKYFGIMNNEEMMDVIFHYRFSRTIKSFFWYFIWRIKDLLFNPKK